MSTTQDLPRAEDLRRAEIAATGVGALTLAIGAVLTAAPTTTSRVLGVADAERGLRVVGVVDLVIAAGLLAARPRWPWLAARAAANPPTAAYLAVLGRRHGARGLVAAAAVIAGASVADTHACRALRAAGR